MLFGLTEEAKVKLGAGENQGLCRQQSIGKQKKNGEMCLAPIFLPQLATGVFFLLMDNYLSILIV